MNIFNQIIDCWDETHGNETEWRAAMIECIDHPDKVKIADWVIENVGDSLYYSGSAIVYESLFKKDFLQFIEDIK